MINKTTRHFLTAVLILAAVLVVYHPLVSSKSLTSGADMTCLFYPSRHLLTDSLRHGIIPLWNPYKFGGSPFLAAMQSGVFYPPNWVIAFLLPIVAGCNVYIITHLFLLGFFFYLMLMSAFRVRWEVATAIAMLVPLGGMMQGQVEHLAALGALCWAPLLFLAWFRFLESRTSKYFFLFTLSLVFQVLAGHPQYVAYTLFFLAIYWLFWFLTTREIPVSVRVRTVIPLVCAVLLAFALCSVQLVPSLEQSGYSYRAFSGYEYAASFSMAPKFLATLVHPLFYRLPEGHEPPAQFGEFNLYMGVLPLLLVVGSILWAIVRRRTRDIFLVAVSAVCVLYALGSYTPLLKATVTLIPVLEQFRVPARILFISVFIWFILVAQWLSVLKNAFNITRVLNVLFVVFVIVTVTDVALTSRHEPFHETIPIAKIKEQAAPLVKRIDGSGQEYFRIYRLMVKDDDHYLTHGPLYVLGRGERLQPDLNMIFSVPLVGGYEEGLLPSIRYKDFLLTYNRNLRNPSSDPVLLSLLNARYILVEPGLPLESKYFEEIERTPGYVLYKNLAWDSGAFRATPLSTIIEPGLLDGTFKLFNTLKLGYGKKFLDGYRRKPIESLPPGVTRGAGLHISTVNSFYVNIEHPAGDILVSIPSYPGWIAHAASGKTQRLEPVNAIMLRIHTDKDTNKVLLTYEPFAFRIGLYLSMVTIFLLCIITSCRHLIQHYDSKKKRFKDMLSYARRVPR